MVVSNAWIVEQKKLTIFVKYRGILWQVLQKLNLVLLQFS
jgi:hypothetical protein